MELMMFSIACAVASVTDLIPCCNAEILELPLGVTPSTFIKRRTLNLPWQLDYLYPKILLTLYMKEGRYDTPCSCALNPFSLELRDSAEAFVALLIKIK